MDSLYPFLRGKAEQGLRAQKRGPKDYENEHGFLICGECGEPRQMVIMIADPTAEDKDHVRPMKVPRQCKCERDRYDAAQKEKKDRRQMERIESLRAASLMDAKFKGADFDHFTVNKENERNCKICKSYVRRFDEMVEKNQGLLFWGNAGTGKTYAAACIANELLNKMTPVVMTSFIKLIEMFERGNGQEEMILRRLNEAKLVIFDDLGAERSTDYALEKVYNIVDSRYRRCLPSIYTTNLTIEEMKNEADIRYKRIYDRIFENCYPMHFTGASWRRAEANRRFREMEKLLEEE